MVQNSDDENQEYVPEANEAVGHETAQSEFAAHGLSKIGPKPVSLQKPLSTPKLSKRRKKKRTESFFSYIYKLLKSIHPDMGMSRKSMMIFNSFVEDIFEKIAAVACGMSFKANKKTISVTEIGMAARLILPGELAKHATGEINRTLKRFSESKR